MVAVTACSVVVSGVLAWLAYRNGAKATKIAQDTAERDEHYRVQEAEHGAAADRAAVALSMLRALATMESYASNRPMFPELQTETQIRWSEALAHIDLYATSEEDEELRVWFDSNMSELEKLGSRSQVKLMQVTPILDSVRRGIVRWNQREVTSGRLAVGE